LLFFSIYKIHLNKKLVDWQLIFNNTFFLSSPPPPSLQKQIWWALQKNKEMLFVYWIKLHSYFFLLMYLVLNFLLIFFNLINWYLIFTVWCLLFWLLFFYFFFNWDCFSISSLVIWFDFFVSNLVFILFKSSFFSFLSFFVEFISSILSLFILIG